MVGFEEKVYLYSGVLLLVSAVFTSLSNGVLLYTMYRNPLRCFRNTTAAFMACLAVTDFITGSATATDIGICSLLASQGIILFEESLPQQNVISHFTLGCGILVIVAFTFERFLAVAFPLFYRNSLSPKKALISCFICVLVSLGISTSQLTFNKDTYTFIGFYGLLIAPLCLLIILYSLILIIARVKLIQARTGKDVKKKGRFLRGLVLLKKEMKIAKTAFIVVLGFLISYTPEATLSMVAVYCPNCVAQQWYFACFRFSIVLLYVNSIFNPMLYAWKIPKYRRSVHLVFKRSNTVFCRPFS